VLVTGASGFIGRHAVPALVAHGFEVHVEDVAAGWPPRAVRRRTVDR
jgi:uncharacterized protein YbjT (DUF2867 family)